MCLTELDICSQYKGQLLLTYLMALRVEKTVLLMYSLTNSSPLWSVYVNCR